MKKIVLFLALAFVGTNVNAQNNQDTSMFPEAQSGFKKVVITLPVKKNEDNLKVELIVGKEVSVDKCNKHFLAGEFKEQDLKGWGYTYYDFSSNGEVAGTKMGCPTPEIETKFVTGESKVIRYNSKLPIVLYVPTSMTVKYRFWSAKNKWTVSK